MMSRKLLRRVDYVSLLIMIPLAIWVLIPSTWFIDPEAIHYDGRNVTLVRRTPLGDLLGTNYLATWSREMHVVGTDMECHAPDLTNLVQPVKGVSVPETGLIVGTDTITYTEGEWSMPCLRAEPPILAMHTWRPLLFGLIPLKPVRLTATIDRQYVE